MKATFCNAFIVSITFLLLHIRATKTLPQENENPDPEMRSCIAPEPICPNKYIRFFLYTRNTQLTPYEIQDGNVESAILAPFETAPFETVPLVVLIHGYTGNQTHSLNLYIRPALLEQGNYNVISVDYSEIAKSPCYITLVKSIDRIGTCVARFLVWLYAIRAELSSKYTHVIGISAGAQVAGRTGNQTQSFGHLISWITALDPANPLFPSPAKDKDKVIDPSDAEFVDAIHSNVNVEGQCGPNGHVDFYLNNGYHQPGCPTMDTSCSHTFGQKLYAITIRNQEKFYGAPCNLSYKCLKLSNVCTPKSDNYNELMGFYVSHLARGNYHVRTRALTPQGN